VLAPEAGTGVPVVPVAGDPLVPVAGDPLVPVAGDPLVPALGPVVSEGQPVTGMGPPMEL